ncbi:YihY/virulence factor BrkB family protein [Pedobacter sp. NJ-S-72]
MNWVHRQLLRIRLYSLFIDWTKVYVLPGFSPIPLYTVASFFFKELGKDSLVNKASSLAYTFMLAIFPGIIFLFTLIPFIPKRIGFQDQLMVLLQLILPAQAYKAFEATLSEIIKIQNGKLLSFGIILSVFFATNGMHSLMNAFNKSSLIVETRTWLKQRLIALVLTFVLAVSLIITIGAMTVGEIALNYINKGLHIKGHFIVYIIDVSRWALLGILYFVTISILYRYGPANTKKKWRFFSPGSWLATISLPF